ncbi:MAG: DUF4968 domain-containing protein [Lachnospiraceae bacterium]|nr:DUF4968 domain-containing protein [Lachnospiraceae bacterium]
MKEEKTERRIYGSSRADEEKQLADIIKVAQENLERTEKYNQELTDELKDMLDAYETRDKEILALWHNTESRFQENKRDLMRCLKARNKPYFGRIDFKDPNVKWDESYYVGRVGIAKNGGLDPIVIDWRAPLASIYYENSLGNCTYEVKNEGVHEIDLKRKRTYEIAKDKLVDFFDSDVVANDELLTKYLAKSKKAVLGEIIGTIQKEQNAIIRKSPKTNLIVQGVAGSGKTTVAMHRISYILYNYDTFRPEDFYIIGSNRILLNYITSVLPDLDVYGVSQMTMEQLFIRLLYEDWEPNIHKIGFLDRKDELATKKGSYGWFHDLEAFCSEYEKNTIPGDQVVIEKNGVVLLERERIETYIRENPLLSMQSKIDALNERLLSRLENELSGKSVSYTPEEKKELNKKCKYHFGKDEWKGSIFTLYEEFLESQRSKGYTIKVEENTYDVYDLAALAYLYKRIKEADGIREASHIIIDEAQDFGMMAYGALTYCLRGCTYTIMGDVSQNIHFGYGLNDWEDLKKLVLTGMYDSFGLLKKSYRNTVEISNFATEILRHGNFPIYPVEPIIRHGSEVRVSDCKNEENMVNTAGDIILEWQKAGHETIAVVCRDEEEARSVSSQLGKKITLTDSNLETAVFEQGVMVLPVEYTKGLEFDAVLIYHPSKEKYPAEDQYVKLLYVAATRALHELAVVHLGDLSELIAKPVSAEKRMSFLENQSEPERVRYKRTEYVISEEKKQQDLERYLKRTKEKYLKSQAEEVAQKNDSIQAAAGKQSVAEKKLAAERHSVIEKQVETSANAKPAMERQLQKSMILKPIMQNTLQQKLPQEKPLQEKRMRQSMTGDTMNRSPYQFYDVVDSSMLTPKGHSRIDSAIRWGKRTKKYVDLTSSYGVLRLTPVGEAIIRVQFQRGQTADFAKGYWDYEPDEQPAWTARESTTQFEVATARIVVRIEKKTGALHFFDKKGTLLLKEDAKVPRQIEFGNDRIQTWNHFDWQKNEKIKVKGMLDDDLQRVNGMARFISFGGRMLRMPLILSEKGYGLGIAAEHTVMYCGIPMYGQYIYTEAMKQVDYYFIYGGEVKETIGLYREVTR